MLDEKHLKQTLRMCLVDEKGKFDNLAREAFGSNQLLARPWVLCQRLAALKEVHPWCDFIALPDFQLLRKKIEEANDHTMQTAERIDDEEAIGCEDALGSDIAQVQLTEVERSAQLNATTASAERHLDGETEEELCDTPMQCRHVLAQPSASVENDQLLQATCLRSFGEMVGLKEDAMEDDDNCNEIAVRQLLQRAQNHHRRPRTEMLAKPCKVTIV
jgi:hypothetical protein